MKLDSDGLDLNVPKDFSREISRARYNTNRKPQKISRLLFEKDLEACHIAGSMNVMTYVIDEHKKNPFNTIDELVGDITYKEST